MNYLKSELVSHERQLLQYFFPFVYLTMQGVSEQSNIDCGKKQWNISTVMYRLKICKDGIFNLIPRDTKLVELKVQIVVNTSICSELYMKTSASAQIDLMLDFCCA